MNLTAEQIEKLETIRCECGYISYDKLRRVLNARITTYVLVAAAIGKHISRESYEELSPFLQK